MLELLVAAPLLTGAVLTAPVQEARPSVVEWERAPGVSFEETARRADEAWAAGRTDEALRLARAGLELNPLWRERAEDLAPDGPGCLPRARQGLRGGGSNARARAKLIELDEKRGARSE